MVYRFSKSASSIEPSKLWLNLKNGLSQNVIIKSISQEKLYTIKSIDTLTIKYTSPERRGGSEEQIQKEDFNKVIENLRTLKEFNSSSAKGLFPSNIYRKRSPIFALLLSASIIEPVK